MQFHELNDKQKNIYCRMVELGIYPYSMTVNKLPYYGFLVDAKGMWYGTKSPQPHVKEEVDALVKFWNERE